MTKVEEIKETLEKYRMEGFDERQLLEIGEGLKNNADISFYARKGIPAADMAYIRKRLAFEEAVRKEKTEEGEGLENIEEKFTDYRQSVKVSTFEKIFSFALMISGLAFVTGTFALLYILTSIF